MTIDTIVLSAGAASAALAAGRSTAAASASADVPRAATAAEIESAAQQIESHLRGSGIAVDVSVDARSDVRIVTVRDSANGSVIRQFPSDQALWMAAHLHDGTGLLSEIV